MRYVFLIAATLFFYSCAMFDKNSPEKVAKDFLEAYFTYDLDRAIELSEYHTAQEIKDIKQQLEREGITMKKASENSQKFIVKINEIRIKGDSAICNYTLSSDKNDANAMEENLILHKISGNWYVEF